MYYIQFNPKDADKMLGKNGLLHLGTAQGFNLGLFSGAYHYIDFSTKASRLTPDQLKDIPGTIRNLRTPWAE